MNDSPDISIIVPTLREAANLPTLAMRIDTALAERRYELIFVDDDSRDGTADVCTELATQFPVRLIVRSVPEAGLSGAVLRGLAEARGKVFVVMDADLQHPPEKIPELLEAIESGGAEFALGSRHVAGAGIAQTWSTFRRLNSRLAAMLAAPFSHGVRDPMSGFFALPRPVYERGRFVAPLGYKIGMELLCKCHASPIREVPIHFGVRAHGSSKLTLKEQLRYLEHLSRLYDFTFPRVIPSIKFLITVTIAFGLASLVFFGMSRGSTPAWWMTLVAYAVGSASVAAFHARYVRAQRSYLVRRWPWVDFALCTAAEWLAVSACALYLARRVESLHAVELLVIPFCLGTLVRFIMRKELLMDVRGLRFMPSYAERLSRVDTDRR